MMTGKTIPSIAAMVALLASGIATAQDVRQVQVQNPGLLATQPHTFGRIFDDVQARNRVVNNALAANGVSLLGNVRKPIPVDPVRRIDLSDQFERGVILTKPGDDREETACDLRSELRGVSITGAKDFRAGFEATPCDTLRSNLTRLRATLERRPAAEVRPVTNDEQRLLDLQPAVQELLPEGAVLGPIAATTEEGTRFTVLFPDNPDRELVLTLKAPDPDRDILEGGPGFVLEVEETEQVVSFMKIEPIFDEGSLTYDPDNLADAFASGDLTSESCFGNDLGLYFNCFGATVAVEALIDAEEPTTFGSAVLIDAAAGLYVSAFHVAEAKDGVFFSVGGTDTRGQVNARFKMAVENGDEVEIATIDETYGIQRTEAPVLNAVFDADFDLIMFRTEPADPDFDPSLLTEARILATPGLGTMRAMTGAQVVGAGYGGSPDEDGGAEGVRRFSRLAVASCDGDVMCRDDKWLVVGERPDDILSEDHEACPSDSGSALFVETVVEEGDSGPRIAVTGILNGRITPEVGLAATSEEFCSPTLRYIDLTHPDVQNWLLESAAVLTEKSVADVRQAYFQEREVVMEPTFLTAIDEDPPEQ
ncbi:MAG: hypothetical protein AAF762_08585 [Pseudomonadota bacterium]